MNPFIPRPRLRVLALLAVLCALTSVARAQFMTNITLDKSTYLTNEAVEATVTISNRSGSDIVMGGPNGQAWLSFEVMDPKGNRVPSIRIRTDETIVFKMGDTIKRKISISDSIPFSEYGMYSVSAIVYHPPTQKYYASNRAKATFTEARAFWNGTFGVPLGLPGAGQVRRYNLSILRDSVHTYLYVRVLDDRTESKLATYSLGTCIMVTDPQVTIDSSNMLHVLFMAVPKTYAHVTVDTQGRLVSRSYYREIKTDRPQLVVQADQSIAVQGGQFYDPVAAAAAAQMAKPKGRSIGEPPPGL